MGPYIEFICVDIEYIGIVEIDVAFLLTFIVVSTKDDDRRPAQGCSVATTWTWSYALNYGVCPLPFPRRKFLVKLFFDCINLNDTSGLPTSLALMSRLLIFLLSSWLALPATSSTFLRILPIILISVFVSFLFAFLKISLLKIALVEHHIVVFAC